jgi:Neurotransmitter-gated ion-channel ligand binding domain
MVPRTQSKSRFGKPLRPAIVLAMILAAGMVLPAAVFSAEARPDERLGGDDQKTVEKAAEEAVEKAVGKAAEKAVEKATEQAVGKAAKEAAESAAAKVVKKTTEEAAKKAELKAIRPDERRGSTKVQFLVFVIDIDRIDDADQSFSANVYIRLRWQDRRLANPGGTTRQILLDQVWNPRLVLVNQTGLVSRALPEVVQVEPDGTVLYYQRYTGKLSQPLNLSNFPLDSHTFTIQFAAAGYTADDLEFVPEVVKGINGGSMAEQLSLPDWKILKYEVSALPYRPIEAARAASFAFRFEAARSVGYYLWQVVLPLAVVVAMSWAAFWVGRENVGVRIGVATSSILTLIAQRFVVTNLLPRLPYMTRMDYFTVGSTILVFLALVVVIIIYLLAGRHEVAARRVDLSARWTFPLAFVLLFGWFMSR